MVFVSLPNSESTFIDVNPRRTTLLSLKQSLHQHTNIPIALQRLFIPSHSLHNDDSTLLYNLGITPYSILTLHMPLLGGGAAGAPPLPSTKPSLDFLNSKQPPNYVAGLGRGATGFTTRSDIGLTRAAPDLPDQSTATIVGVGSVAGAGRGKGKPGEEDEEDEGYEKGYDENQKFDEFEGNDVGLFANSEYDGDDKAADAVWEAIDKRMDSR